MPRVACGPLSREETEGVLSVKRLSLRRAQLVSLGGPRRRACRTGSHLPGSRAPSGTKQAICITAFKFLPHLKWTKPNSCQCGSAEQLGKGAVVFPGQNSTSPSNFNFWFPLSREPSRRLCRLTARTAHADCPCRRLLRAAVGPEATLAMTSRGRWLTAPPPATGRPDFTTALPRAISFTLLTKQPGGDTSGSQTIMVTTTTRALTTIC